MAKNYIVKVNNKPTGPFSVEKIGQFIKAGKLNEKSMITPEGENNWDCIENYTDFKSYLTTAKEESTSFISMDKIKNDLKANDAKDNIKSFESNKLDSTSQDEDKDKDEEFKEFSFDKNQNHDVDYEKIEKEIANKPAPGPDKTVIRRPQKIVNVQETLVVNPIEEPQKDEEDEIIEEIPDEKTIVHADDETKLLQDIKFELETVQEIKDSEKQIVEERKKFHEEIDDDEKSDEDEKEEVEEKTTLQKGMKPITLFAFVVILAFLFLEDDNKKVEAINPQFFTLTTIYANEYENEAKSNALYEKAVQAYLKGSYQNKVNATLLLKESLANQTSNRDAMGLLILTYAEIIDNVKNKQTAKRNFNLLLKISESRILKDENIAVGAALFYSFYDKHSSAIRVLKSYLRLAKLTPEEVKKTPKIYATLLKVLIKAEKFQEARDYYEYLKKIKYEHRSIEVTHALSMFEKFNENFEEREKDLISALEKYPSSVLLLLELADNYYQTSKIKNFQKTLSQIEKLRAEESPIFYAKFLEYIGLAAALTGQNKKAVLSFRMSLHIFNNDSLRSRLASLETGGNDQTENLIKESKSVKLIEAAEVEMKAQRWDKAFMHAIDAVDVMPNFIPAELMLAKIQTRRGFYQRALKTLEKLQAENPTHFEINNSLVEAYINARQFEKAQTHLTLLSREKTMNFSQTAEFSSLQGRLFYTKGNIPQAIEHLKKSTVLDPLNEKDFAVLAKIYLEYRKYSRAKATLIEAINLEPFNVDFRALYGKILYELDSAETAIGYLKKFLEDNHDNPDILGDAASNLHVYENETEPRRFKQNPKLIGEIATYHYLNGDNNEFKRYKEMLEKQNIKEKTFYEFMINASKLEKKVDDIILYAQELIKIEPGDLATRMLLGEYLYKENRLSNAEEIFQGIKERLDSYPKVHYFIGKIYIRLKRYEDALAMGLEEIKLNPELTHGYYIAGLAQKHMQNFPESVLQLEKAISKDGKNVEALITLGEIRYGQNFLDSARELYLRAKRHSPSTPEIYKQLGYIYRRMGQSGLAAENFQVYLNRSPLANDREQIQTIINSLK